MSSVTIVIYAWSVQQLAWNSFNLSKSQFRTHTHTHTHTHSQTVWCNNPVVSGNIRKVGYQKQKKKRLLFLQNKTTRGTNNVTLRRFVQQLLQCKRNTYYIFRKCVCSLWYPVWNAHAPYCHLWPLRLYCICPHCLINGTIKKKLLNIKYVFIFSTTFVWHISHSKKNRSRYDQIRGLEL